MYRTLEISAVKMSNSFASPSLVPHAAVGRVSGPASASTDATPSACACDR